MNFMQHFTGFSRQHMLAICMVLVAAEVFKQAVYLSASLDRYMLWTGPSNKQAVTNKSQQSSHFNYSNAAGHDNHAYMATLARAKLCRLVKKPMKTGAWTSIGKMLFTGWQLFLFQMPASFL